MDWETIFYNQRIDDADRARLRRKRLQARFKCAVWGTRDKRLIPVTMMRESHLRNAIAYFTRQGYQLMDMPTHEAVDDFETTYRRLNILLTESNRRGIPRAMPERMEQYYGKFIAPMYDRHSEPDFWLLDWVPGDA